MKLVIGLGNPGRKYEGTRHNVGFGVLDLLAKRSAVTGRKVQFQGEVAEAKIANHKALLLWPATYMNLSGASVLAARDFYKLELEDLLVVCDDFNLTLGKLRLRPDGSAGGQKGLDNILVRLGTDQIARLRLGVGPPEGDPANFVLSRFRKEELFEIEMATQRAAEAVECWAAESIESCMNKYN